ncbi:MAG: hypothetical protein WHU94_12150 [Thermogemmata sp.]|uniref:DUF3352 domain-containing protein n=1 Tax=Thermogemmata fonticola TaxID=2755323 RepID=A0A7V8VE57_9BACT|nr:hypothetical protein [Thermogemmata fonticola]MBA2226380.1 hypothetical protein [Thermogemmata fonticola]
MSTWHFRLGGLLAGLIGVVGISAELEARNALQKTAQEQPAKLQPTLVFQGQPVAQLLALAREALRRMGKEEGPQLVESFDSALKKQLGDKGFAGLDLNRPWGGFAIWRAKSEDTAFALILPITDTEAFLDLLQRLEIRAEKDVKDKFLYKIHFPSSLISKSSYLRLMPNQWAYLLLNVDSPWPALALPKPEELWRDQPQTIISLRLYPGRVPQDSVKELIQGVNNGFAKMRGLFAGNAGDKGSQAKLTKVLYEDVPSWLVRNIQSVAQEAEELEIQLRWELNDPGGQVILDAILLPRPGTPLARVVQQRGQSQQRFSGLAQIPSTTTALVIQPPQFAPEWRKLWSAIGEIAQEEIKGAGWPKEVAEVFLEIARSWQRDSEEGKLESAILLREPNAKGHYSAAAVLSCSGSKNVEKALKHLAQQRSFAPMFEMDAAKAGEWTVHRLKVWPLLPAEVRDHGERLFGENPALFVACGPDALGLAVGPEALTILRQISQLQPGPGAAFEWHYQPKQFAALVTILTGDEEVGEQVRNRLGQEKNSMMGYQIQLEGGEQLRLTIRFYDRLILASLKMFFDFRLGE